MSVYVCVLRMLGALSTTLSHRYLTIVPGSEDPPACNYVMVYSVIGLGSVDETSGDAANGYQMEQRNHWLGSEPDPTLTNAPPCYGPQQARGSNSGNCL